MRRCTWKSPAHGAKPCRRRTLQSAEPSIPAEPSLVTMLLLLLPLCPSRDMEYQAPAAPPSSRLSPWCMHCSPGHFDGFSHLNPEAKNGGGGNNSGALGTYICTYIRSMYMLGPKSIFLSQVARGLPEASVDCSRQSADGGLSWSSRCQVQTWRSRSMLLFNVVYHGPLVPMLVSA